MQFNSEYENHNVSDMCKLKMMTLGMQISDYCDLTANEITQDVIDLTKLATDYEALQVQHTTGGLNVEERAKEEEIEDTIERIAHSLGLKVVFDGDPRVVNVKLTAPDGTIFDVPTHNL